MGQWCSPPEHEPWLGLTSQTPVVDRTGQPGDMANLCYSIVQLTLPQQKQAIIMKEREM